jgi:hypothetical protein
MSIVEKSYYIERPNNSLERTQPQRGFMYDVAVLRRLVRSRYAAARDQI